MAKIYDGADELDRTESSNHLLERYLNHVIENLESHGIDPYTPEFIFGHNDEYTRLRNERAFNSPGGRLTLLSMMLRYGLEDKKRKKLFTKPFDLGCKKNLPDNRKSLVELAKFVRKETKNRDDLHTRNKEFENILASLKKITGRKFLDYKDKQNSLRVIYRIDRMMRHPKYFHDGLKKRTLTFIKPPTSKFSFEARSEHRMKDSEDNSYLLNDLKAYLSIEMNQISLEKIDSIFNSLIDRMGAIQKYLESAANTSGNRASIHEGYQNFQKQVLAIKIATADEHTPSFARLDQDLYTYLHKFEFRHYIGEHKNILGKAKPPSLINSIEKDLVWALEKIRHGYQTYHDVGLKSFRIEDLSILAKAYPALLLYLIKMALEFQPSEKELEKIVPLADELLYRCKRFGEDMMHCPREDIPVNFLEIISALCAVSQALQFRTHYRPWIYGNDGQPRSIITPLEKSIDSGEEIQEGYLHLWHNRFEWVHDALQGWDVTPVKFALRKSLWNKAIDCISYNDINLIDRALAQLEADLLALRLSPALQAPL